jgi:predicted small lipoprotein YifL
MIRKALLLAAVITLGACADPAARIAAPDAAPSQECNRQNGSGSLDCP